MESTQGAEPIAVIGMGMRLPGGVSSSEDFWKLLMSKEDIRCVAPESRYSTDGFCNPRSKKETISTPLGYFLDESVKLGALDTSFFNLNQLQAQMMDPQQRLLLEVAWECMENAGQANIRGSNTGVFAGSYSEDWSRLVYQDTQGSNAYRVLGTADFNLSSVLSYHFDLRGPSITLRTACSAASTGLHMACQALYNGDCSAALVAGTSIIMSPSMGQDMTSQGVMSPTGLCKTFDASADGYARAEGVNVVMVKLLKDAIRDQDPIRAVIRSTAVNSDGGSSNLSVPSPVAQKALIKRAYEVAAIDDLSRTAFVECHGTGTRVGDPIEAGAVGESFGDGGIYIGSVKTNLGHTEGGSGITGLMKSVLALEHGIIPPNLNFTTPNPQIPFEKYNLQVPIDPTPWPLDKDHRISINCFGIGGSNSHVVLDSAASFMDDKKEMVNSHGDCSSNGGSPSNSYVLVPDDQDTESADPSKVSLFLLPVSAAGEHALSARTKGIGNYIQSSSNPLPAIAHTLSSRRYHLSHRAFAVVDQAAEKKPEFNKVQKASKQPPRLGFVFTGQGAQHAGMGKELYNAMPSFRGDVDAMNEALQSLKSPPKWALSDFFTGRMDESLLDKADYSQPLSTALQIALVNLFAKWGIKPDLAMGHSSGELAAAYASGRLTMAEACKCSYVRGAVTQMQTRDGGMAVVGLKPTEVRSYLVPGVQIACINSAKNVTISGDRQAVQEIIDTIAAKQPNVFLRVLKVDRAYHSYHMEELSSLYNETLTRELEELGTHLQPNVLPLYSTVTGRLHSPDATLDAEYWARSLASPVQFLDATQAILKDNVSELVLIEIGPHPGLKAPIRQIVEDHIFKGSMTKPMYLPTLSRDQDALRSVLTTAGHLYTYGYEVDFAQINSPTPILTDLPNYPWDHRTVHWGESRISKAWRTRKHAHHELLGSTEVASGTFPSVWRNMLRLEDASWLKDHTIGSDVVFPCAGYIAMMGEAIRQITGSESYVLRNMTMKAVLLLRASVQIEILTTMSPVALTERTNSPWYKLAIASLVNDTWVEHCVAEGKADKTSSKSSDHAPTTPLSRAIPSDYLYDRFRRLRLDFGPRFRLLQDISAHTEDCLARATIKEPGGQAEAEYAAHPTTLDALLQLSIVAASRGVSRHLGKARVPSRIGRVYVNPVSSDQRLPLAAEAVIKKKEGYKATSMDGITVVPDSEHGIALEMQDVEFAVVDLVDDHETTAHLDRMALGRCEWRPHLDFCSIEKLLKPAGQPHRTSKAKLEQLTALCILECLDVIEKLDLEEQALVHMVKYISWLRGQRDRMARGEWLLAPDAAQWLLLDETSRRDLITQSHKDILPLQDESVTKVCELQVSVTQTDNLKAITTGEMHPLELFKENDRLSAWYDFTVKCMDAKPLIAATAHAHPNLRILEIGAGTGGTSEAILRNLLSPKGTRMYSEYMFTDISAGFLTTAQERLAQWEGVEYKVLDISKSPAEQGFQGGQYDLVLATNVIHATPCLEETLKNVHFLLRPGGRFLLQELLSPPPTIFVPFIAGFFSGWWDGEGDDRSDQPIVSVERWNRELLGAGFGGIEAAVPDDEDPAHQLMMQITAVVPNVAPTTASPLSVTLIHDGEPEPFAHTVAASLESDGLAVSWCDVNDPAKLGSISHDVIAVLDLEHPFFEDISEEKFNNVMGWISRLKTSGILWLTRAAQVDSTNPAYAQIIGLARTVRVEASIDIWTVEMQSIDASQVTPAVALARRFLDRPTDAGHSVDCEFAIHEGTVMIGRYDWSPKNEVATTPSKQEDERKSMRIGQRGLLNTIYWVKDTAPGLGDDEVQLNVHYSGLNFKDVMIAMRLIPGDHELCGCEAAGIVTNIGSNVHNVKPGDRVFTLGRGLLSTRLNVPAVTVFPIPDSLGFEAAATLPAVYCTAIHAIFDKAKLEKGQSILIHAASGGVGQAALQLCRMLGVNIYATVGSEEKIQYLVQEYGLDRKHIFNSRDDSFYQNVMRATQGRGVDMVLNSLSGELLHASWKCVARFGIMVEIGKRDMLEHGRLPLDMFSGNRTFCGIDLDSMQDRPQLLESLMQRLLKFYAEGHIKVVSPIRIFSAENIQDAFRYMQTGKHIGKIVIQMPEPPGNLPALPAPAPLVQLSSSASYLLTGGLGGLGKVIATWMVERGAKSLIFLSRSAGLKPSDGGFVRELESQGCSVTTVAGSVTILGDVHRALEAAPSPVAGVIHLSNVLRDKPVRDVRHEDWSTVQGPKVTGTWNLHKALMDHKLDFFILCGSLSAIFGQPGQASYSAANAFLDSFVQFRHNMGLPCSTIDFGAVEGVGGVKDSNLEQYFRNASLHLMQEQELIDALQMAIQSPSSPPAPVTQSEMPVIYSNAGQFTVGMASTRSLHDPQNRHPLGQDIRMGFARQLEQKNKRDIKSENDKLKQFLTSVESHAELLNGADALELLTTEIGRQLCVFVMKAEVDVGPQTSLESLGVDSLVSIEIRNWWKRTIGTDISVLEITNAQTIQQLGATAVASLQAKFVIAQSGQMQGQSVDPDVSAEELVAKFATYMDQLEAGVKLAKTIPSAPWPKHGTVLVTGGTGYLGTEILKQLLEREDVGTVIVLVRAASVDAGMDRIRNRAQSAGWWEPEHQDRIEIWLGDLSAPKVGLCEEHVSRVRGESITHSNVDAIIHNGAMVKLDASFTSLEAPNVTSTVELLSLSLSSKKPVRFIYVSGGLRTDISQPFDEFADELSTHLAYSRTKNLSDRIILAVVDKLPEHQRRVSVAKPGLLLGSVSTGYTKREDFLSQFIGVVGATRSCPSLCSDRWLYVSTVGKPAATIVKQLYAEDDFKTFEATADGMFMSSLTEILAEEFGLTGSRPSWDDWTRHVTESVTDPVMQHAISAITELKRYEERLPLERQLPESMDAELRESLRSSVRYLAGQT